MHKMGKWLLGYSLLLYTLTHIKTICNMNKIKELIDSGVITTEQVLRYADDYYINMIPEQMREEMINDEWTTRPEGYDDFYPQLPTEKYPEYVVVSTSYDMEETFAFPGNEHGVITNFGEIAALARRWCTENGTESDYNWEKHDLVIKQLHTDEHVYTFVEDIEGGPCAQSLWKKVIINKEA